MDENQRESFIGKLQDKADLTEPRPANFPGIKGLCRMCRKSLIRQQEFGDQPEVICQAVYDKPHRVPYDIMKCTGYERRGEMDIRTMANLALLIDARPDGGQYL